MSAFFGELSPFQILISIVALFTGAYTLYKNFWERAVVRFHPGDRVAFVISGPGEVRKFHVSAYGVNAGVKTATIQRLEVQVTGPGIEGFLLFPWGLFFDYTADGTARRPSSAPHALAIAGKSSLLTHIEFELLSAYPTPRWTAGEYVFDVRGWVNQATRAEAPNCISRFHVQLKSGDSAQFAAPTSPLRPHPLVHDVPVREWAIP